MVKLTKPRPPICTNTNTTALPNRVSPEARSNRVSPVTVTADTAVKNASNQPMDLVVDQGSFKSIIPMRIRAIKPNASTLGGLADTLGRWGSERQDRRTSRFSMRLCHRGLAQFGCQAAQILQATKKHHNITGIEYKIIIRVMVTTFFLLISRICTRSFSCASKSPKRVLSYCALAVTSTIKSP